jgi:hypothetical protein
MHALHKIIKHVLVKERKIVIFVLYFNSCSGLLVQFNHDDDCLIQLMDRIDKHFALLKATFNIKE